MSAVAGAVGTEKDVGGTGGGAASKLGGCSCGDHRDASPDGIAQTLQSVNDIHFRKLIPGCAKCPLPLANMSVTFQGPYRRVLSRTPVTRAGARTLENLSSFGLEPTCCREDRIVDG